jgi:hypothetical protein
LNWQTPEDEDSLLKAAHPLAPFKKQNALPKIIWLTCENTSSKHLQEILYSRLTKTVDLLLANNLADIRD